jgi:NACalpha-BTF3-like transcription factor
MGNSVDLFDIPDEDIEMVSQQSSSRPASQMSIYSDHKSNDDDVNDQMVVDGSEGSEDDIKIVLKKSKAYKRKPSTGKVHSSFNMSELMNCYQPYF